MANRQVDLIIPCYNMSKYLPQAIESCLAQTYNPLRIVVVDDGSTEDIRAIVERYKDRVDYVQHENRGLPAARNTGIRCTDGSFLCFLDADDIILPSKIENQVQFLEDHPQVDLVYGRSLLFSEENILFPYADWRPFREWDDYLVPLSMMCPFPVHSALLRRRLIDRIGSFPEEMRNGCEDWSFWLNCILNGAVFAYSPKVNALYRKHEKSMSTKIGRLAYNEYNWIRLAAKKFEQAGLVKGKRGKIISCGIRFVAARLLSLSQKSQFLELMNLAAKIESIANAGIAASKSYNSASILYLQICNDLFELGLNELAHFCFLHAGDIRLLRLEASGDGLGGLFDNVIRTIEKSLSYPEMITKPIQVPATIDPAVLGGRRHELFENLEKCIPESVSYLSYLNHQLGLLDQQMGRTQAAAIKFKYALALNPYYFLFHEDLVNALRKGGRGAEAEEIVGRLINMAGNASYGYYYRGKEFFRRGKPVSGIRYFKWSLIGGPASFLRYVARDIDKFFLKYLGPRGMQFRLWLTRMISSQGWIFKHYRIR